METKKFDVTGMTCAACVAHVEKSVKKLEGIEMVNVQLMTNSMTVAYDGKRVSDKMIEDSVRKAGYDAFVQGKESVKDLKGPADYVKEEQVRLKNRFWFSAAILMPLLYLSMGRMFGFPIPSFLAGYANLAILAFTQFLLLLPILFLNRNYYKGGYKSLFQGSPTMDSLIAIGSSAAVLYGIYALYKIGYGFGHGAVSTVVRFADELYFESAATILVLITLGRYLEARSKGKTSDAITKLLNLVPKTATIISSGLETEIAVEDIQVGDEVVIKPGQSVPVDGVVFSGSSSLDESALTGESMPVYKQQGDRILSASVNQTGYLTFTATKVGTDTTLSQIIRLVEEASASKAPISRLADRISSIFVPAIIGIAVLATIIWLLLGYPFEFALSIGIAVLVISCPCALGLATPVAIMVGTGKGAEYGILIKSAEALEMIHKVDTVVLDKTGTITEGKPTVTDIMPDTKRSKEVLLKVCASLEKQSEHPLAGAVLEAAKKQGIDLYEVNDFSAIAGEGVEGLIDGIRYFAGNLKLMKDKGVALSEFDFAVESFSEEGKTPLFVADEHSVIGVLAVSDQIKPDSKDAIRQLQLMGIDVYMLTGDNMKTAEAIRKKVGIQHVLAEVLPQEKDQKIAALQSEGKKVAMVGDGINDAPALSRADVGIAIGAGSDIAVESADAVLVRNSLSDVVTAIQLSKAVIRNIKQNLFWAFFYNVLGIPLAAGVFYVAFGWKLNPMFAAAAMSFSSLTVVTNALRLRQFKPKKVKAEDIVWTSDQIKTTNSTMMKKKTMTIEGMSCEHCVARVTKALNGVDGVKASVSLPDKAEVILEKEVGDETLKKAVEDAGYEVSAIKEA